MNKKFLMVSISIFLSIMIFIGFSKVILKDKESWINSSEKYFFNMKPTIKYEGYEEEDGNINIKISFKNNFNGIASIDDLKLSFGSKKNLSNGEFSFKGFNEGWRSDFYNYKNGIDREEESVYVFQIPKGIKFDEDYFDLSYMNISYNVQYFRFRIGSNALLGMMGSTGGSLSIENTDKILMD
ncbi:hypothetical protein [Clostridium chauvoei]|uniref:Uncharacterized protein n=2 Tax=Clostridium chauvoei TaxID=46867 RepID=A0A1U6J2G6_9CLOT|nr:hypothetical protein [Clostridium chauvoei]ATD54469.1 hypothetical protein BTM20_04145 [Clostridium chauvoei]ATD57847.1 hypothetical protein BTM21_08915 [Clostridium chauvoei]MBX7281699.1 hypothetical protein [Clostridium chauvoei]MBX7284240.1 hypothetical protein [Clostridium chauvoei]MBX7286747.1 hypothetical protein [Clostridium chauvoei]